MKAISEFLGKAFSVTNSKSQKILAWTLIAFSTVFTASIFLTVNSAYRANPDNPFNLPTVFGIFLSLAAFFWSVAIAMSQKELSEQQNKQNKLLEDQAKDIESIIAAKQKYCPDLHSALYHIHQGIVNGINESVENSDVVISLYTSSLALGCISGPVGNNGTHALDYYNSILKLLIEFGQKRKSSSKDLATELHLYVWNKSEHRNIFSLEGDEKFRDCLIENQERVRETIKLLREICSVYANNKRRESDTKLFLHSTQADIVRFFQIEKMVSEKRRTVESSMILMMPSLTNATSRGASNTPDLSCMALWDGTEKGRDRMGGFFEHYKLSCCAIDHCEDGAKAAANLLALNFDDPEMGIASYFGTGLLQTA